MAQSDRFSKKELVDAVNAFTLRTQGQLEGKPICGINVFSILLMIAYGFQGGSRKQILDVLGLEQTGIEKASRQLKELDEYLCESGYIRTSNSVWHRHDVSISPEFVNHAHEYFDGFVGEIDAGAINSYVRKSTQDKIDMQVNIRNDVALMLVGCLHFKADWASPFESDCTFQSTFHPFEGELAPCNMMTMSEKQLYFEDEFIQAVLLPYKSKESSLLSLAAAFVLPKNPSKEALLSTLSKAADPVGWRHFLGSFSPKETELYIPRFEMRSESNLGPVLKSMGMSSPTESSLDFWARSPATEMSISEIVHATFLKCDEVGTEIAAQTIVEISDGIDDNSAHFLADRPFWFAALDRSQGAILYSGLVENVESPDSSL